MFYNINRCFVVYVFKGVQLLSAPSVKLFTLASLRFVKLQLNGNNTL